MNDALCNGREVAPRLNSGAAVLARLWPVASQTRLGSPSRLVLLVLLVLAVGPLSGCLTMTHLGVGPTRVVRAGKVVAAVVTTDPERGLELRLLAEATDREDPENPLGLWHYISLDGPQPRSVRLFATTRVVKIDEFNPSLMRAELRPLLVPPGPFSAGSWPRWPLDGYMRSLEAPGLRRNPEQPEPQRIRLPIEPWPANRGSASNPSEGNSVLVPREGQPPLRVVWTRERGRSRTDALLPTVGFVVTFPLVVVADFFYTPWLLLQIK